MLAPASTYSMGGSWLWYVVAMHHACGVWLWLVADRSEPAPLPSDWLFRVSMAVRGVASAPSGVTS